MILNGRLRSFIECIRYSSIGGTTIRIRIVAQNVVILVKNFLRTSGCQLLLPPFPISMARNRRKQKVPPTPKTPKLTRLQAAKLSEPSNSQSSTTTTTQSSEEEEVILVVALKKRWVHCIGWLWPGTLLRASVCAIYISLK